MKLISFDSDETRKKLLDVYLLKNITRYNNKPTLTKESVAEHTFYVALFSMMLCDEFGFGSLIKLQCIEKSLLHDMPEIEINDITHDTKVKLHLDEFLKKYEDEYYRKNFAAYAEMMQSSDKIVDMIVDFADALSVKQYAVHEIEFGNGSAIMAEIEKNTDERLEILRNKILKEVNA